MYVLVRVGMGLRAQRTTWKDVLDNDLGYPRWEMVGLGGKEGKEREGAMDKRERDYANACI